MKHLIRKILSMIFPIFKPFNKKCIIFNEKIYSIWINSLYNFKDINFKKPVNIIKNPQYFDIGTNTEFGKMAVITAWDKYEGEEFHPYIKIGMNCSFGDFINISCIRKMAIGDNVLTGRWVTITDNNHGNFHKEILKIPPLKRKLQSKGEIIIEDNVWIGDKSTILSGVKIGKGSIIGANTLVNKDVPPYALAFGNPMKIIE